MTIATLLFTVGLVYVIGDLMLGMAKPDLMFATLLIAAIVASSAAIAGDVMQDLKTGHMLGATPKRQQVAEIVGVLTGAVVIGPVLSLLHDAFRISQTACQLNPLPSDPTCSKALFAPQAELIGAIVQGAFGGDLNIQMVVLGAAIAVALIRLQMPVMSVAIGIYLPLGLSVPIMVGGVISHIMLRSAHLRVDGVLREEPSEQAVKAAKEVESRGGSSGRDSSPVSPSWGCSSPCSSSQKLTLLRSLESQRSMTCYPLHSSRGSLACSYGWRLEHCRKAVVWRAML